MNRNEAREVDKLCEVCMESFKLNAVSSVADAEGEPVVFSYSCVDTLLRTEKKLVGASPIARRCGGRRAAEEFLVQQGFLRCKRPSGDAKTAVLLTELRPLKKDKGAWSVFECAVHFVQTLHELGHQGICTYDLVF